MKGTFQKARPNRFLALACTLAFAATFLVSAAHHAAASLATAGDLDPEFGGFAGDGEIEFDDMNVVAFVQQDSQGLIVLGVRENNLLVRRISYDGEPDTFFGQGGTATFLTTGGPSCAFGGCGIAVQSGGSIIVVGNTSVSGDQDFLVYRLLPTGQLDTTFGQNGSRTIDFNGDFDQANAVAVQADDRIVVAGYAQVPQAGTDHSVFATARLTSGGDLDTSFSDDGLATEDFVRMPGQQSSFANSVAIQPDDGRIVVGGQMHDGLFTDDRDFGLLRYMLDGKLDESFGDEGRVNTGFGGENDSVTSLYIQPDGRIVAAGFNDESVLAGDERILALARYNKNGLLDNTFSGGKFTTAIKSPSSAVAVAGQPDGKLLVVGESGSNTAIARYNADGSLDSTYSDDGIRILMNDRRASHFALQPDGKVVVASNVAAPAWQSSLRRYQANLLLLDRVGSNTTGFGYGPDRAYGVARTADGGYLVAGESQSPLSSNGLDVVLVRYTPSGHLDRTFGENGRAEYNAINDDSARAMAVQPDGKILVAGFRFHTINEDFALWRFNADGSADSSFGSGGLARGFFGLGPDYGQDLVVQADGKIVVAGFSETSSGRHLTMIRFDADGERDDSFGDQGDGRFVEAMGDGFFSLRALTEMPDGDLLAVGGYSGDFWAYRFTADGVPDPAFGNNGYMEYALSGNDEARAVDVLPSGLIAIGGYSGGDFGLLLVLDDGSMCLEPCGFTIESRIRIDMGGDEGVYDLAVQSNGKIVLVGSPGIISNEPGPMYAARVHRSTFPVLAYGIDTSFGNAGKAGVSLIHGSRVHDVLLHHDRIVLAGQTSNGVDDDIALARLLNDHGDPPPPPPESHVLLPLILGR